MQSCPSAAESVQPRWQVLGFGELSILQEYRILDGAQELPIQGRRSKLPSSVPANNVPVGAHPAACAAVIRGFHTEHAWHEITPRILSLDVRRRKHPKRRPRHVGELVRVPSREENDDGIEVGVNPPESIIDVAADVEGVRGVLSMQYPEIATAAISGPEAVGDTMKYTFERAIGAKG
jgi:PRTRC genetic system protein C